MASSSTFEAKVLMAKGKRATAAYIHADCSNNPCPQHLNDVLDGILNPAKSMDDWETIDWCKWLMAGGRTPEEFSNTVRAYDNQTTCGLVWTPNFVAYRCRTCGMSPCMSLCTDCFKKGNHQRHDFNMFLSQAGGACDCGDTSVMKETGFCDRHGPDKSANKGKAPRDLMCVAEAMMPRILFRFLLHLREICPEKGPIQEADDYITMLQDFNNMGALMRRVMTSALTNPQKYKDLNEVSATSQNEYDLYVLETKKFYQEAMEHLANPEPYEKYKNCRALLTHVVHKTFLEELVFWTVFFEFPEKIVCLLLNMLPDPDYKEALMRAIVLHYSRISLMLERTNDPENVSNRVVHASVQLFSNESLALQMTEQMNLLHVMVISLRYMMTKILILNTIHDPEHMFHMVVDCSKQVMAEHCYWPLVSDLNNVLSHRPVALNFMADDYLIKMWFGFLNMFQGMNVNQKETKEHIKYDPNTYFAAFSAELEACAYPMWALVSHLTDGSTANLTKKVLAACNRQLAIWFRMIKFTNLNENDNVQISFHLPLHRYFSVFLCQGVGKQGITLDEVLPPKKHLKMMIMHPLRVLISFYEILIEMWKKNGLQMTGQAMTYIQGNFCNSMVDADLYLLQVACTRLCPNKFMSLLIDKFHVTEYLSLASEKPQNAYVQPEQNTAMLESFLTFIATLVTIRTNIGLSETEVNRLEMVTLLCLNDRTHSQLMELVPERCGTSQTHDFETLLVELANYRPPVLNLNGGNLQQGMYSAKAEVWENLYDPIYLMLRAVHRTDPNTAYSRYCVYVESTRKDRPKFEPWPPYREPKKCSEAYQDPRLILKSRVFHAVALVILHQALKAQTPESTMSLIIFLLDQAVTISKRRQTEGSKACPTAKPLKDMQFSNWFAGDCIFENLTTVIDRVVLAAAPEASSIFSDDEDTEMTFNPDLVSSRVSPNVLEDRELMTLIEVINRDPLDGLMARDSGKCEETEMLIDTPATVSSEASDSPSTPPTSSTSPIDLVASTSGGSLHVDQSLDEDLPTVEFNDSIISLLLKLHSLLSGIPNSYKPEEVDENDGRMIGDGPFYIGRLLKKISRMDETCKQCIQATRTRLFPTPEGEETKKRERDDRKRRAEERRAKLMADMANKQKEFMVMAMETDENAFDSDEDVIAVDEELVNRREYECIICNKSSPSYEDKPMGLVTWIQPTNVTGHRRRHSGGVLPTCDEEKSLLKDDATLYTEFEKKLEDLSRHFNPESWYLTVGVGLDTGAHVQTCGHYVHLECLNPYLKILNRMEYECPLCKTLANSVLPITPDWRDCSQASKTNCPSMSQMLYDLREFLQDNILYPATSPLMEAIARIIEIMTDNNQLKPTLRLRKDEPIFQGLSVARTNLETELCQRGGTLVTTDQPANPLIPKRDCIVHVLHVLAVHAREARASARWPAWTTFQQLRGMSPKPPSDIPVGPLENEVPLLLKDPIAVLLQFIILLPPNLDQNYFRTTIQMVYNLLYYQVVAQISCCFTRSERMRASGVVNQGKICTLADALALINRCLGNTALYMEDDETSGQPEFSMAAVEVQVRKLCLPYLRIASLLKHHIYQIALPEIRQRETEFVCLVHYLGLVTEPTDWDRFNAAAALSWPTESQMYITSPLSWFSQYAVFVQKSQIAARSFLMDQHITWYPPRLLQLPNEYEKIFTYYHKRPCTQCQSVPVEAAICLLCGTLVCLRQGCCKQQNICEAVAHTMECGSGTGIFLVVTSTYTIIIRGRQACLWGSLYLDEFAEEDKDLKRGKPLYLCQERFQLLEQQWLAHRFDHIKKNWVFHNNAL